MNPFLPFQSHLVRDALTESKIANQLWERCLKYKHLLHLPDILIHPKTRTSVFPQDPIVLQQKIQQGFVPLSPGDFLQYHLFGKFPFWSHQALYVGQGYIVELVRITRAKKPLAQIILRPVQEMFVRGSEVQFIAFDEKRTTISRLETIRRALSTIGYYHYSIFYFNCHNAILAFQNEHYEGMSNGVLYAILTLILGVIIVILCIANQIRLLCKQRQKYLAALE